MLDNINPRYSLIHGYTALSLIREDLSGFDVKFASILPFIGPIVNSKAIVRKFNKCYDLDVVILKSIKFNGKIPSKVLWTRSKEFERVINNSPVPIVITKQSGQILKQVLSNSKFSEYLFKDKILTYTGTEFKNEYSKYFGSWKPFRRTFNIEAPYVVFNYFRDLDINEYNKLPECVRFNLWWLGMIFRQFIVRASDIEKIVFKFNKVTITATV